MLQASPPETPAGERNSPLRHALELDIILSKVLGYLSGDDLGRCRLVCRRWHEVTRLLPVTLCTTHADIDAPLWRFPYAKKVKFTGSWDLWEEKGRRKELREMLLWRLAYLTSLERLTLKIRGDWLFADSIPGYFYRLSGLKSLTVIMGSCDVFKVDQFSPSLAHLTNLTKLVIRANDIRSEGASLGALTGLEKLEASIHLIVDQQGQLRIPELTRLKHLTIRNDRKCLADSPAFVSLLEKLQPFESTLCSLKIPSGVDEPVLGDILQLTKFSKLSSLCFDSLAPSDAFIDLLRDLPNLAELKLGKTEELSGSARFSIHAISNLYALELKSLTVRGAGYTDILALCNPAKLTELRLGSVTSEELVVFSTSLVKLHIQATGTTMIRSVALEMLSHLKELELEEVRVEQSFFETLAKISDLAVLKLTSLKCDNEANLYPQVCKLTALEVLSIESECRVSPLWCILGARMNRLRDLRMKFGQVFSKEEKLHLKSALPSLKHINRDDSWLWAT